METQTDVIWRLVGIEEGRASCDSCGHDIANLYFVTSNTSEKQIVGSECVKALIDPADVPMFELLKKRRNRAAKQWRDNKPAHKENETREQYINRRLLEMQNVWQGYRACVEAARKDEFTNARRKAADANREQIRAAFEGLDRYSAAYYAAMKFQGDLLDAANDAIHERIEFETGSNRFDYNQAAYRIRKI